DLVCAGAEPALVGTDDGHPDDPRPGLGGGHLPGAVRVADPWHRQLEPCDRLRDHDDRLRHDHALALTPARATLCAHLHHLWARPSPLTPDLVRSRSGGTSRPRADSRTGATRPHASRPHAPRVIHSPVHTWGE